MINRRTKIVTTAGPASSSPELIEALIEAGVTVFRLNMSHGEHAGHQAAYDHIRLIAERLVKPIAVLADLCGPKIRTGKFEGDGIDLLEGDEIKIIMGQGLGWDRIPVCQQQSGHPWHRRHPKCRKTWEQGPSLLSQHRG